LIHVVASGEAAPDQASITVTQLGSRVHRSVALARWRARIRMKTKDLPFGPSCVFEGVSIGASHADTQTTVKVAATSAVESPTPRTEHSSSRKDRTFCGQISRGLNSAAVPERAHPLNPGASLDVMREKSVSAETLHRSGMFFDPMGMLSQLQAAQ
jgi:hypothetical protein